MSKIKQKDTKPEILVRSFLHNKGLRFRKNVKSLPSTPDIYLPKYKTVILVQGCYWHRHKCKRGQSVPTKNKVFWIDKFTRNVARDRKNLQLLQSIELKVIQVWSCELTPSKSDETLGNLYKNIIKDS